jgi:hypothetical protein
MVSERGCDSDCILWALQQTATGERPIFVGLGIIGLEFD